MDIGFGKIKKEGESYEYEGTLPLCDQDERVCVVRQFDLELIMHAEEMILLRFPYEMRRELFEPVKIKNRKKVLYLPAPILDEMVFNASDGTKHKLFLDHHLYSHNPRDTLWARWCSVDISFMSEEP